MTKKLIVMVGFPGAGKSHHVNVWKEVEPNMVVFSTDNILQRMVDDGIYNDYNHAFRSAMHKAEKQFWNEIETFAKEEHEEGITVVLDRTNLTEKSRRRIMNYFDKDQWERVAFVVQHPLWKDRAQREGKNIPLAALESMEKAYRIPSFEEGFDNIFVVPGGG